VRPSDRLLLGAALGGLALAACWLDARGRRLANGDHRAAAEAVRRLGLTDLCLFTEARYTRHLSQSDHFAPFQDQPGALEHFPSGSLVAPPRPE
jgi:hypothetical protein